MVTNSNLITNSPTSHRLGLTISMAVCNVCKLCTIPFYKRCSYFCSTVTREKDYVLGYIRSSQQQFFTNYFIYLVCGRWPNPVHSQSYKLQLGHGFWSWPETHAISKTFCDIKNRNAYCEFSRVTNAKIAFLERFWITGVFVRKSYR